MSPVAPDAGGRVVISQVRPPNAEGQPSNAPANIPKTPDVSGTTQIFVGILLISFGVVLTKVETQIYDTRIGNSIRTPIWSGILFITSGSLSVSASRKPTAGKVTASLVMNIFSFLAAAYGIIMSGLDIDMGHTYRTQYRRRTYCAYYNNDPQCLGTFIPQPVEKGLASYVFLLYALMMCITISTSVFAFRTVCRRSSGETSAAIHQSTTVNVSDTTRDDPPDYSTAIMTDTVVIYQTVNVPDTTREDPPDYSTVMKSDLKAQTGSH